MTVVEVETPLGRANAHLHTADDPVAALVLGHGAGGGVEAPDLVAATEAALSESLSVALVEQPYRVAGRRSPPAISRLEVAWTAVVEQLVAGELRGLSLIAGGRSLGGRVACRTVDATAPVAVLCLAFPFQPRRRKAATESPPTRLSELDQVKLPTLVVQGDRDQFGMPPAGPHRTVVQVPGDHGLKKDLDAVATAVHEWLPGVVRQTAGAATTG